MSDDSTNNGPKPDAAKPADANATGEDRALSALKRLARPQPKAFDAPAAPVPEMPLGAGSATGFVGTLAKGADDSRSGGTGLRGGSDDSRGGADDSRAGEKVGESSGTISGAAELIQMAREISVPRPASPIGHLDRKSAARRGRYRGLMPLMVMLGIVLLVIGGWAIGALVYMHNVMPMSPRDVTYPLITWTIDLHAGGAYSGASVAMAWAMLACVPVGILLLIAGIALRKSARRGKA